jgi:hypothetical protein
LIELQKHLHISEDSGSYQGAAHRRLARPDYCFYRTHGSNNYYTHGTDPGALS